MKDYKILKRKFLKDAAIKKAYDTLEPEYKLARLIIQKRLEKGLTQKELAIKTKTKQSAIARLESGNYNPSILSLFKIAKALKSELNISLRN